MKKKKKNPKYTWIQIWIHLKHEHTKTQTYKIQAQEPPEHKKTHTDLKPLANQTH